MLRGGYTGTVLRLNLTERSAVTEPLNPETARRFLGGAGFAIKTLFDEVDPKADPLGSENRLIFALGPTTGTKTPCSSRMAVAAKSPQTGAVGLALTGGHFPAELKAAGYDMVIVEGRASSPVYVVINDAKVTFRSADGVWGTHTGDCQLMIKNELRDPAFRVACIGPAGEQLSRMAGIINERRAAGRKGLGAVMGSKNLKAIAVKGSGTVTVADPQGYREALGVMSTRMKAGNLYTDFRRHGSSLLVDHIGGLGLMPSRNWTTTGTDSPQSELGIAAQAPLCLTREACKACPVGCAQLRRTPHGPYAGTVGEAEFESIYSLGSQNGITDPGLVNAADRLCDELGLDTISAGVTVGFAMELAERGLLPAEAAAQARALDLRFGNGEALMALLRQMATREGLGALLADGTAAAVERIGHQAAPYAMHVKKLEMPGYDVRGAYAQGLNYATAFTGADHNRGFCSQELFGGTVPWPAELRTTEHKGALTIWNQDMRCSTSDCATMCGFIFDAVIPEDEGANMARLLSSLTGLAFCAADIRRVGERVTNVARLFNHGAGFGRTDDTLPERLMTEPLPGGLNAGGMLDGESLNRMLDEYYTVRGWTLEGVPTRQRLEELELGSEAQHAGI